MIDVLIAFSVFLTLAIVVTAVAHIWVAVPFIPTPMKVAKDMLEFAKLKGDETLYDLGAGDARLLIVAKRAYPNISAIGVEIVPTVWALGKLRILCSRQDVTLRMRNILSVNVSDADCIFLYLIPNMMKKLEDKFQKELKPGTKIVSYAFSLPNKTPVKEMSVPWLTGERKLRMYEW
ncbi:hypothetical protein COU78_04340 [Candidatus Peregrinibacteria bacterium CG10_big_fil_rev_8_21_14_0_10_49_24]|nr:MAG: hypothetical protein COV83_00875 [Candidatus Peregrinibacteria bacterium CG11_big_fil_rev_8_21_14_0_20_49_14]PIR50896.1 MAG: hypothetical protein COU78_04340 [Candidatus Peregrinibacteria bacterium CG10_big_fil_rev_8_21_14_0_10_49_24]PJA67173.1 MAG: hypothetical protein CO157_06270 [Candidatus Peregrinibacteria bacterium CG_4_9_14_3_um_filter_49_12]